MMRERFVARPEWQFAASAEHFDPQGEPLVELAFEVAKIAHRGQTRRTGEPYINHVVAVTSMIRDVLGIKIPEMVASGLLHDVVEDCGDIDEEQLEEISRLVGRKVDRLDLRFISETFGEKVAFAVDSVTKLDSDWETVRKLILQGILDPMGLVDKCVDRLHNMSTLADMPAEKQVQKARETMNVHTHLAESLGIWVIKNKLEDMAFEYLDPEKFREIRQMIDSDPRLNPDFIDGMVDRMNEWFALQKDRIEARVEVRVKGYWEAHKKRERLIEEGRSLSPESFGDVADLVSFRILVKNLDDADRLLGRLRRDYKEINDIERYDDFVTEPADNGYSAYHLIWNVGGRLIEIAITTEDREEYNNWGVVSLLRRGETEIAQYARIMVFSPNEELHFLPQGATGVDYARAISPRLLAQAVAMIIDDGEPVDIRTPVPNAAKVFIVTDSQRQAADLEWANHCVTREAKREIMRQQEQLKQKKWIAAGRRIMEEVLRDRGLFYLEDLDLESFNRARYALDVDGVMNNIYTKIGAGTMERKRVIERLDRAGIHKENAGGERMTSVRVEGPDIEGTMAALTGWIAELGGSLSFSTNRAGEGHYEARLVVRGLTRTAEDELRGRLTGDVAGRYSGVEVI